MFEKAIQQANAIFEQLPCKTTVKTAQNCFADTLTHWCKVSNDSAFVITGDIPAMWLRDSSAQVMPYVAFADDYDVHRLIKGVLRRQFACIIADPYANAFMENTDKTSYWADKVKSNVTSNLVWEHKFELDSLCYPLFLLYKFVKATNDTTVLDWQFVNAFDVITNTLFTEMHHDEKSPYYYYRKGKPLHNVRKATKTKNSFENLLVWTAFRPSDDKCKYHYHVADNMFVVSVMHKMSDIFTGYLNDTQRANTCREIADKVRQGIERYGIVTVDGIKIYASETDCKGHYLTDDDANVPSLLSIPYLEYPFVDNEIYLNTRKHVLSTRNGNYVQGNVISGIGSKHTPVNNVWPLSVIMQALTSCDKTEITDLVNMLVNSTDNTFYMHESIHRNNQSVFTRSQFGWANSLFAELILTKTDYLK